MPQYLIHYDQGNALGPFNIYLSGSSGLNLYASNVTKTQLESGFIVTFDDAIPSSSVVIDNTGYSCDTDQQLMFPTPTPTITPTITITPSISSTPFPTPTRTPSITPTISVTPTISITPTKTPSLTPTKSPSLSPGTSLTPTPTISVTRTPSITPSTPAAVGSIYISNFFFNGVISDVLVNGISISGASFPLYPGGGTTGTTTQLGTYTISIQYGSLTLDGHVEIIDSNLTNSCQSVDVMSGFVVFNNQYIDSSTTVQILTNDGATCP